MYNSTLPSTSALDVSGWSTLCPCRYTPGKDPVPIVDVGGWLGYRAGLDGCGKSRPPPGFHPRTVQPVASSYTNCNIPTPTSKYSLYKYVLRVGTEFKCLRNGAMAKASQHVNAGVHKSRVPDRRND